ncbi:MAG: ABC transporter permease [Actinomycetota bacterium]
MILLTLRDLRHRAVRFAVVTVLGAVVFTLLFVMTGLVEQFNREPYDTVDAFGASTWVTAQGISGPFTASSPIPASSFLQVEADDAVPAVVARSSLSATGVDEEIVLVGHVPGALGAPPTVSGRSVEGPGEAVIDDTLDIPLGEVARIGGDEFTVVGWSRDTSLLAGIPLAFVSLEDAQDVAFRTRDVVSVVLADGPVDAVPDGTVAVPSDDIAESALGPLDGAIASVDLVRVLLWLVAAVIIGAVVYLSALERQRDFAVLKAVGVSDRSLLGSLALQAALVALLAVGLAAVIQIFLAPVFPLKVRVPDRAFWQLPLLAIVVALLAGVAGMRRVARSDPALAFSGAGG